MAPNNEYFSASMLLLLLASYRLTINFGRSVKLLMAFASTVIPGFSLLEIHDQDLYSFLEMLN
jgi:hypothetical protein